MALRQRLVQAIPIVPTFVEFRWRCWYSLGGSLDFDTRIFSPGFADQVISKPKKNDHPLGVHYTQRLQSLILKSVIPQPWADK